MSQQPIFFAVTRSFWLTVSGIALVLEQGQPVVRAIATLIVALAGAFGIAWDVASMTAWCMDVAPAVLWVAAMQQRAHAAQLLHMRAAASLTGSSATPQDIEREVYQKRFLVKRPLLEALQTPAPGALLLIDEVDRADEPFEAFLLEYLGEYQVSIPELGTIKAEVAPVTILTSNRTRDLNDAVKRRCLYQWMDYPDRERELAVVRSQVPQASAQLTEQVAEFVGRLRSQPFSSAFQRAPGIAESVEWAKALVALDTLTLDPEVVQDTVGILFKQREDIAAITPLLNDLLAPAPITSL